MRTAVNWLFIVSCGAKARLFVTAGWLVPVMSNSDSVVVLKNTEYCTARDVMRGSLACLAAEAVQSAALALQSVDNI